MGLRIWEISLLIFILPACSSGMKEIEIVQHASTPAEGEESDEPSSSGTEVPAHDGDDAKIDKPGTTTPPAENPPVVDENPSQMPPVATGTCTADKIMSKTHVVSFPARQACQFGKAPNLPARGFFLQAVEVQEFTVPLIADAKVCALSLTGSKADFRYDDYFVLTLDHKLLINSQVAYFSRLDSMNGAFIWDFSRLVGRQYDYDSDQFYCFGSQANCSIPKSGKTGAVNMNYDKATMERFPLDLEGKTALTFRAIVTGDDESTDCFHNGLSLNFNIDYLME